MLTFALWGAGALLTLALALAGYRLLRGPTMPDRVLALDTLYITAIGLLMLLNINVGTHLYFEAALLIAVLGFLGTVVLGKFLLRGDIIE
jgi:multicomponent K+:H+ antiporter subunit F